MNQKMILGIAVVIVAVGLGWFFFASNQSKTEERAASTKNENLDEASSATPSANTSTDTANEAPSEGTITYTGSGFSPKSLTIKSGGTITWTNNSSSSVKVGSDVHPIHTINPEITGNQFVIELAPGESRSVKLTKTGEWGVHDHLKPSMTGTLIVQ